MRTAHLALISVLAGLSLLCLGCEPAIGDACETNLDCPAGAQCDTTAPEGYCLLIGCDRNADCPDESVCVLFEEYTAFCMASCGSNGDCRSGYVCRDDVGPSQFCYVEVGEGESPFERAAQALRVLESTE